MLPTFLRRRRIFAFCRALCSPLYCGVEGLYNRFLQKRGDHIFSLSHNGQVCYIRAALNYAFGLSKGFEIDDADSYQGEWVFAKDASMTQQLTAVDEHRNPELAGEETSPDYPMPLLSDEAKLTMAHNSFIVRVPSNIYTTQLDKVKAIVDRYRLPSKTPIYVITNSSNEQSGLSINGGRPRWQWPLSIVNTGSVVHSGSNHLFTGAGQNWR